MLLPGKYKEEREMMNDRQRKRENSLADEYGMDC
jgi:hypothetical protein